ncbi:MAG TPA: family 43 glycosylhydrolase [Polyangiaceae bacterium]|nr:family 43 glycosylhydrolase [Polyangiaceae bacterium]
MFVLRRSRLLALLVAVGVSASAAACSSGGGGDSGAGTGGTSLGGQSHGVSGGTSGLAGGPAVPPRCSQASCSGNGVCSEVDDGLVCVCDEGFQGDACEARAVDHYARTLLVDGLADPDVFRANDDSFFLTGTAPSARVVPIYHSTDLDDFTEHVSFDPSAVDAEHDYCHVWAPELTHYAGSYELYFSAHRVAKGAACPPPAGQTVTTFHVAAPTLDFQFGVPELVENGAAQPASRVQDGCNPAGCASTIRIDAATYDDGDERWFFYVWFQGGNNIAAYPFSSPGSLHQVAGPATFAVPAYDESINEGPDVFFRDGRYYLFFSGGFFDSQYAMYYVMADDVAGLTRARAVRRHSIPVRSAGGQFVETHGHNSVVERRGEFFNVFHQGQFDASGSLTRRSTYKQRLGFGPDGSMQALNYVDLSWSRLPGAQYSLDVLTREGVVHGPCVASGRIGNATSRRFEGICPDDDSVVVPKADVAAFRLFHSTDGNWGAFVEVPYHGVSDRVFVPLPGGSTSSVALRWSELTTDAEYSLDVQRTDGSWIAPCVGAGVLGSSVAATYDGNCTTAGEARAPAEIRAFRVCSAVGGNWAQARCGTVDYDGSAGFLDVVIP